MARSILVGLTLPSGKRTEKLTVSHPPDIKPEDWARFIELKPFEKAWKKLGLDDKDRDALHLLIMMSPEASIVAGTGGLRKMRFSSNRWSTGKRKGARVCYAYYPEYSVVVLITIYLKGRKEDLTGAEKNEIRGLLEGFEASLKKGVINV